MENATEFLQGVLALAREEQLMSEGRLMSSTQVAVALSATTPRSQLFDGWFLCGDIHPELFEKLKTGLQAKPMVWMKEGETGVRYFLFAQQFGNWQHRFLVPLIGKSARQFLRDIQVSGVGVSLSTVTMHEAVVSRLAPSADLKRFIELEVPMSLDARSLSALFDEVTLLASVLISMQP